MQQLFDYLGITPFGALSVVIAATVVYFIFTLVISLWWKHLRLVNTPFTFALTVLLGAIMARTTLGDTPTLAGGVIAVVTLLIWEFIVDRIQNSSRHGERSSRGAVVMVGGAIDEAELRGHGIRSADVYGALRRAGIRRLDEVAAVVLEGDGSFTVLRAGHPIDRRLLVGVKGASRLSDDVATSA